jgi:hypothetical protein
MIVSGHGESAGSRRTRISTTTDRIGRGDIGLVLGDEDWSRIRAGVVWIMTSQSSYLLCTGSRGSELREHPPRARSAGRPLPCQRRSR